MSSARYREADGSFEIAVPAEWSVERDGEGGLLLARRDGAGLLHIMPFERDSLEFVDPAEELYSFLEDQEIELEEDEVEDIGLAGNGLLAMCEYLAEEAEETVYWLIGVATAPGRLVFASYSCVSGSEEEERVEVRRIMESLRFDEPAAD